MKTNKKTETKMQEVKANETPVMENRPMSGIFMKRDELRKLSKSVMPMVKEGTYKNVNMALIESCYKNDGNEIFKSYEGWKMEGFQVKKGEKAFLIWARPTKTEDKPEDKFFRVAFLFSNLQVEPISNESKVEEPPVKYGLAEIKVSYTPSYIEVSPNKIGSSKDASDIFRNFFQSHMEHREAFYVLYLNRANKPLGIYQLSIGGQTGTVADPKICMQVALKSHACGMILAHNHPSGNLQPSESDIDLTRRIKAACTLLDVQLLDHVILTQDSYFSFADEGKI
ncbi:MAG TPA: JAB domain-containing protein [Bacteroidia bacterium]|nr:JAB domain-containing protein [Bacteroidia bacterium]